MDKAIRLIYCDGKSKWRNNIAAECGFLAGTRHGDTVYRSPLYFIDQNWKNPQKEKYIAFIKEYKPIMATVIDIIDDKTLFDALNWSKQIAQYITYLILIPKIPVYLPKILYDKEVILGYSVPTQYGGTFIDDKYFHDHKVHLLGGSPHRQLEYSARFNIFSIDINYHGMMATKFRHYWTNGTRKWLKGITAEDCFRISCNNIKDCWDGISNTTRLI